jgi:hypothetical protein
VENKGASSPRALIPLGFTFVAAMQVWQFVNDGCVHFNSHMDYCGRDGTWILGGSISIAILFDVSYIYSRLRK